MEARRQEGAGRWGRGGDRPSGSAWLGFVVGALCGLGLAGGSRMEGAEPVALMISTNATGEVKFEAGGPGRALCRVLPASEWARGALPLFAVSRKGRVELRRLPPAGLEGQTEPVGCVLPLEDEVGAGRVSGRWTVVSRKADGAVHRLAWELAASDGRVSGRFDPDTDYRFAFIAEGEAGTNSIAFTVEYIQDRYRVTGTWADGGWKGVWRRPDDSESGEWTATRAAGPAVPTDEPGLVRLWEWRRVADSAVWYGVEGSGPEGEGWERGARALGRVWPARGVTGRSEDDRSASPRPGAP